MNWFLVILSGIFSLGALLLFWQQDVIIAQNGGVSEPHEVGVFDNNVEYLYTLTFVGSGDNAQTRSIR